MHNLKDIIKKVVSNADRPDGNQQEEAMEVLQTPPRKPFEVDSPTSTPTKRRRGASIQEWDDIRRPRSSPYSRPSPPTPKKTRKDTSFSSSYQTDLRRNQQHFASYMAQGKKYHDYQAEVQRRKDLEAMEEEQKREREAGRVGRIERVVKRARSFSPFEMIQTGWDKDSREKEEMRKDKDEECGKEGIQGKGRFGLKLNRLRKSSSVPTMLGSASVPTMPSSTSVPTELGGMSEYERNNLQARLPRRRSCAQEDHPFGTLMRDINSQLGARPDLVETVPPKPLTPKYDVNPGWIKPLNITKRTGGGGNVNRSAAGTARPLQTVEPELPSQRIKPWKASNASETPMPQAALVSSRYQGNDQRGTMWEFHGGLPRPFEKDTDLDMNMAEPILQIRDGSNDASTIPHPSAPFETPIDFQLPPIDLGSDSLYLMGQPEADLKGAVYRLGPIDSGEESLFPNGFFNEAI